MTRFRCAPALVLLALTCADCAPPGSRPDVLLIVIDTLRADRLGVYGAGRPTSPRLDRLAEDGVVFRDTSAQSSWTRPSMVSLFAGRYVTDYRDMPFEDGPALAEVLRGAGYRTYGAIANVLLSAQFGFGRGFDEYDERHRPGSRSFGELGRAAGTLVDDMLATLRTDETPGPRFVYLHFMDPHQPYEPHADLAQELPLDGAPAPDAWQRELYLTQAGEQRVSDEFIERSFAEIHEHRGYYDREVRSVDDAIARLLDGLQQAGRLENTLVAVVSDHGEGLCEHATPLERRPSLPNGLLAPPHVLLAAHGVLLTQNLVSTPFLLAGPGVPAGRRIDAPVENVDLFPTLLELCDVAPPAQLDGKSLVPWLHEARDEPPHAYVFSYVHQWRMVREVESGWKLVLPNPPFAEYEHYTTQLYHLPSDPRERHERSAEEPEIVARLSARLDQWRRAHPVQHTADREASLTEINALRALGYIGADSDALPGQER